MFLIPDLGGGGAEKILLAILKGIDRSKYECSLALFQKQGQLLGEVPDDVAVHEIGSTRHYRLLGFMGTVYRLWRLFRRERTDLVFSVINVANFPAALAAWLAGVKSMVYEVSNPLLDIRDEFAMPMAASILLRITYPLSGIQVALSEGIRSSLIADFGQRPDRIIVTYVPLDLERIDRLALERIEHDEWFGNEPVVLGVGALVRRKGFHVLISAAALAMKKRPLRLVILGQGEELGNLESHARALGIADNVHFAGFESNPYKYFARSAVFVFSSFHEGLGIVVVEALRLGTPVVSTDCPVGPAEILEDGRLGLLVPTGDHEAMAEAIIRVLDDNETRAGFIEGGRIRAMDFDQRRVISALEVHIDRLLGR